MPDGTKARDGAGFGGQFWVNALWLKRAEQRHAGVGSAAPGPPRSSIRSDHDEVTMRYFLQRLLQFVIVFFLVTFGVMVFMRIGMNKPRRSRPSRCSVAPSRPAQAEAVNAKYHLERQLLRPVLVLVRQDGPRRLRDQRAAEHDRRQVPQRPRCS